MIRFVLLSVYSPFVIGIYKGDKLVKKIEAEGKASDVLPVMIEKALSEFAPEEIYYTNGPGNHMSLKIAFVCVKSLCIIKKIPLFGVSPFVFNEGSPIKAFGNSYFVPKKDKIEIEVLDGSVLSVPAVLPHSIDFESIKGCDEPLFLLPAV